MTSGVDSENSLTNSLKKSWGGFPSFQQTKTFSEQTSTYEINYIFRIYFYKLDFSAVVIRFFFSNDKF